MTQEEKISILKRYTSPNQLSIINLLNEDVCISNGDDIRLPCRSYRQFDDLKECLSLKLVFHDIENASPQGEYNIAFFDSFNSESVLSQYSIQKFPIVLKNNIQFDLPIVDNLIYLVYPFVFAMMSNQRNDIVTYNPLIMHGDNLRRIEGKRYRHIRYIITNNKSFVPNDLRTLKSIAKKKVSPPVEKSTNTWNSI